MDALADRLGDELRSMAGRRKRLLAAECDDALVEAAPHLRYDPERRRRLVELLVELRERGELAWSAGQDRSVRPALPAFVVLAERGEGAATPVESDLPWRPELEWVYLLRLTSSERDVLAAVQAYRRDRVEHAEPIPHRERSLQLFGDEKRIDRLVRSRLFEADRLNLGLLDAYWAAPPIAWSNTRGAGPVVVSENAASWHTLVRALTGKARAVAYGGGGAFSLSVAGLADIPGLDRILYIGDLDAEGVAIPQRAATAAELIDIAAPEPHRQMWSALVDLASVVGQAAAPVPTEVAVELCAWFGDTALAKDVQRLLESGVRVPQEALTLDRLAGIHVHDR